MSARELITEHLDLWTGAVTKKASSGRGSNGKVELTGIKKLRELILELAVMGRLVEPGPDEEPAHHLLSRIEAEKSRLAARGLIKKPKKLPEASDSKPYSLPPHWCWVRLGNVTNYGTTDKAEPNQVTEDIWVLELEDIEKESSRLLSKVLYMERQFKSSKNRFERGDVLYGKLRPYLDKVLVADEPGVCTTEIIPIRGYCGILPEFLRLALKSPSFKHYANDSTHGMNLPRLGTDKARLAMIPLAPEQEQHRIVQKVDDLMALCDRLEQQTGGQLEAHETLVDTLLGTLAQSENATELADNWARLANHFDTLFTTEKSIDKLKQTILQLAVMGRLVEQHAGDESANTLRKRIAETKAQLISAGSFKKQKPSSPLQPGEMPFKTPRTWEWVAFGEITFNRDAERIPLPVDERRKRSGDFDYYGASGVIDTIDHYLFDTPLLLIGEDGANLINRSTPIAFIARGKYWVNNHAHVIDGISEDFLRYLCIYINAISLEPYITGTAQPKMNQAKMNSIPVPLPPEEEQIRIVQKVDELMALCDQLKERLNQASETRYQLAVAVVEKAIS